MFKIFILSGPNINNIGKRDRKIYGTESYQELESLIRKESSKLSVNTAIYQTNSESAAIEFIQGCFDCDAGIVNLGAWTHYNYALRDALADFGKPFAEVHISNIFARESFRRNSVISDLSSGIISGFGIYSYILALYAIIDKLSAQGREPNNL